MPNPKPDPVSILLADDHRIVREGLRSALLGYPAVRVVGEAANGREVLEKVGQLKPDVVLMDISMPLMNGLETTRQLRETSPATRVIALTMHDNKEYVSEILRFGAKGYVLKDASPEELVQAILSVMENNAYFSPTISRILLHDLVQPGGGDPRSPTLSRREKDVLVLITRGKTSKEIAQGLGVGVRTVETHRARMMRKFRVRNTAELTKLALARHLIS